jgi:DNA helicase II / ATP-dependent DNA helicase PcrA
MILSHPDAPEGEVKNLGTYGPSDFPSSSAVLCRNTAPLVRHAYGLLHRDIPCRILGRDIGAQLRSIVQKMHATNLEDLRTRLATWHRRETERAIVDGRSPERIDDQYTCLCFFIDGLDEQARSVSDLLAKIDLMFDDSAAAGRVTLCTIHRAKGLEWPTVFILDRELSPSRYAKQPWQQLQERNLQYVAVTRAQQTLVYISSGCWKTKE